MVYCHIQFPLALLCLIKIWLCLSWCYACVCEYCIGDCCDIGQIILIIVTVHGYSNNQCCGFSLVIDPCHVYIYIHTHHTHSSHTHSVTLLRVRSGQHVISVTLPPYLCDLVSIHMFVSQLHAAYIRLSRTDGGEDCEEDRGEDCQEDRQEDHDGIQYVYGGGRCGEGEGGKAEKITITSLARHEARCVRTNFQLLGAMTSYWKQLCVHPISHRLRHVLNLQAKGGDVFGGRYAALPQPPSLPRKQQQHQQRWW